MLGLFVSEIFFRTFLKTMNTKKILHGNTYQQSNDLYTFSDDVRNWKSVLYVHTKKKEISRNDIETYLRKYFSNHMAILRQYCQVNHFIDRQTFEEILRK